MSLTSLFLIPLMLIAFVCLSFILAWIIKKTGLSKNLNKQESNSESKITSHSTETKPGNTISILMRYKLHLPYVQGLLVLGCALVLWLVPFENDRPEIAMPIIFLIILAFTAFSILSPIVNLFLPRWWLNTGLFILSWFLLLYALQFAIETRAGSPIREGAIMFYLPMQAALCILPLTGLVRLIIFVRQNKAG